jgi:hypothetical protein
MSLTQQIILLVPSWLLALLMIGGTSVLSVVGLLTVRHFIPQHSLKNHHEVASPIFGTLGTIYAVFLAFIVIAVWQNFDRTSSGVQQEAIAVADLYRNSEAFAPEFNREVGDLLREYRQKVVRDEWKALAQGKGSPEVEKLVREIWTLYTRYTPRNPTEQSFFDESVEKLNTFRELRRQRLMDAKTGIHALLWVILIAGGVVTISFTFLFGVENLKAQMIMEIMLSAIIALILFTILSMDFPFSGSISVSPAPLQQILLD